MKKTFRPDHRHTKMLKEICKMASMSAVRESKKMGLTIMYMEGGKLYKEFPDGTREEICK